MTRTSADLRRPDGHGGLGDLRRHAVAAPPVIARTTFSSSSSSPKVAKICIDGLVWSGVMRAF
jgi:hypothetical protein